MTIDSSALVAILRVEEPHERILNTILRATEPKRMSAANQFETALVLDRANPALGIRLDQFLVKAGIEVMPFTVNQSALARRAYRDFGKGTGHAAGLNFGDCFAYALAKEFGDALLFVGEDFTHTDIAAVAY